MENFAVSAKKFLKRASREATSRRLYIDCNTDYRASVLLAGNGRGGTTWVADIINHKNEYRYIHEPFHPVKSPVCREFKDRQYLRPENREEKYAEAISRIFSGRIRNRSWSDRHNRKFICRQRLVKEVRANLLLKWIHTHLPGIPIVLLMRHPCAVANSQLKKNMGIHFEDILAQQDLVDDYLSPFREEINRARSDFEKHIFLWCIENYVPLSQFREGEIHLAFYENFCLRPEQEIKRLFAFLKRDYDARILAALDRPSATGSASDVPPIERDKNSLVNGWRRHITAAQFDRAMEIMSLFGLENIYTEDVMPRIDHAHEIMGIRRLGARRAAYV